MHLLVLDAAVLPRCPQGCWRGGEAALQYDIAPCLVFVPVLLPAERDVRSTPATLRQAGPQWFPFQTARPALSELPGEEERGDARRVAWAGGRQDGLRDPGQLSAARGSSVP